jgi:hypothetical protein
MCDRVAGWNAAAVDRMASDEKNFMVLCLNSKSVLAAGGGRRLVRGEELVTVFVGVKVGLSYNSLNSWLL